MTKKVYLVDDEIWALKELLSCIDWAESGFEICGSSTSPVKAIEEINTLRPDLVLSDVSMREMDGLELAERIHGMDSRILVCFISAYDDFGFVKKAIGLSAVDYLLKPIDVDELKAVLKKIKDRIENGAEKSNYHTASKRIKDFAGRISKANSKNELIYCIKNLQQERKNISENDFNHLRTIIECKANEFLNSDKAGSSENSEFWAWTDELIRTVSEQEDKIGNTVISKVIEDINNHIDAEFNLTDYASTFGYSVSWISQLFKKYTGEPFVIYLVKARVERAKKLILSDKELSLSQISFMVGYNDYYHFSKIFKKYTGYSPKSFKDKFCKH